MTKAKAGKIIKVENKDRKFGANPEYLAIWVESESGNEHCLLFTERELSVAKDRADKNKEDIPRKGFFADRFD